MDTKKDIKKRNSSVELLRILMMLQIVYLHVCDYGDFRDSALGMGGKHALLYWGTWLMCRCPVFMFIIITGYYMSDSKSEFNIKRIVRVYIPMYVYSLCIPLLVLKTGIVSMQKYVFLKAFFPFLSRTWYFMTLYLIVLALAPYLNRIIQGLSKKDYLILLGITFFIFSIWQTLANLEPFDDVISIKNIIATNKGKSLYDFVFMYLLGGYMKHYHFMPEGKLHWWKNWMNIVMFFLLGCINVFSVYHYSAVIDIISYNDNVIVILQSIFLFRFFANIEFHSRAINTISACNLGIYMIHEHPLMRSFIWGKVFNFDRSFYREPTYVLLLILTVLLVYFVCGLIEFVRQQLGKMIFGKMKIKM